MKRLCPASTNIIHSITRLVIQAIFWVSTQQNFNVRTTCLSRLVVRDGSAIFCAVFRKWIPRGHNSMVDPSVLFASMLANTSLSNLNFNLTLLYQCIYPYALTHLLL
jgi:hypothetical protein